MTIFVDDIAMPAADDWGYRNTKQTAYQLLEQSGMHSQEKPIRNMNFLTDCRSDWLGCMPALPCHSAGLCCMANVASLL